MTFSIQFDSVKPFREISSQFSPLGIEFDNATSIHPSNPAFDCNGAIQATDQSKPLVIYFNCASFIRIRIIGNGTISAVVSSIAGNHLMSQQLGYFAQNQPHSVDFMFSAPSIGQISLQSNSPFLVEQVLFSVPQLEALPA